MGTFYLSSFIIDMMIRNESKRSRPASLDLSTPSKNPRNGHFSKWFADDAAIMPRDKVDPSKLHKTLRTLTYNIWFSQERQEERFVEITKLILEADADVVCL